ncbi:hypothetical protein [Herbiconiux sp. L3-i23]|uniref:hypothetical protein n=1 Tax=Herbiconiux sp. L3-i23 TaxID=2905871 RepID=UPI002070F87C|nr:hypothetical protein [Herbiconiux sp. L3-i23]BDI22640.1 hypothetical protein L3i23_14160 [Herbiconiux sp. L3-i23]
MPPWSWVLIWVGLVLALLAVLAACGWMLFRKAMTAAEALGELTAKLDLLDGAREELAPEPFVPSILQPRSEVDARYDAVQEARSERRERRRELRIARGRLLTSAEATRRVVDDAR